MEKMIFMPNNDEVRQLMENAWKEFCEKAGDAGMSEEFLSLMHDIFIWGYCAGYNDSYLIIRDQMAVDGLVSDILKQ